MGGAGLVKNPTDFLLAGGKSSCQSGIWLIWIKMSQFLTHFEDQNDSNWAKLGQIWAIWRGLVLGQFWLILTKSVKIGLRVSIFFWGFWPKMVKNGHFWTKVEIGSFLTFWPGPAKKWSSVGGFGRLWPVLVIFVRPKFGHFGQIWRSSKIFEDLHFLKKWMGFWPLFLSSNDFDGTKIVTR